ILNNFSRVVFACRPLPVVIVIIKRINHPLPFGLASTGSRSEVTVRRTSFSAVASGFSGRG
ncbi:hypothetical protein, partial [Serratia bockelmannii]|uniref:hypothetical protein n=1 Tax=Serratia bockelmannii TaxID=2703793 RepID=UPI003CF18A15